MPISVRRAICVGVSHMLLGTSWSRMSRRASCSIAMRFTLFITAVRSGMVTGEVVGVALADHGVLLRALCVLFDCIELHLLE
jgi:hypothetical protein